MKRKAIFTLLTIVCLGITVSCSTDSDMLSEKELLENTLMKGSWQTSFQHEPSNNASDQTNVELTFSELRKLDALTPDCCSGGQATITGSYQLFYHDDDAPHPDEELEYYYDRQDEGDLYLSMTFYKNELVILNGRWRVKSFTSTSVLLQGNNMALNLSNQ